MRAFWAIFDVLWAVEAAQVNCQMDLYRQTLEQEYVQDSDTLAETALEQLESVRESLFSSVFESQTSSSILCALTSTLVGWYETPPGSATSMKAQEYTRIVADMKTDFENALKFFKMWLINRALCLRASPIENTKQERLSRHFHSHMRDWVQQSSTSDSDYQSRDLDQIYIVNCANLHPVPKAVLEDKLRLSDKLKAEVRPLLSNLVLVLPNKHYQHMLRFFINYLIIGISYVYTLLTNAARKSTTARHSSHWTCCVHSVINRLNGLE